MKFLKNMAAIFAAAASVFVFAGVAQAQATGVDSTTEKPFTVKIGGVYFTDADDDEFGFSVGLVYDLGKTKATQPIVYSIFADYASPYGDTSSYVLSGGIQARYLLAPANGPGGFPYLGAGIGAYYLDFGGDDDTKFGGKLFAGYELKSGLLGEIGYNITGESNANFVDFRLGFRF